MERARPAPGREPAEAPSTRAEPEPRFAESEKWDRGWQWWLLGLTVALIVLVGLALVAWNDAAGGG